MPLMHISSQPVALKSGMLGLANSEHLGAARGANPLGGWPTILHSYVLWILHFSLGSAFNTIGLHRVYLLFYER
jgi:hypothetical protein